MSQAESELQVSVTGLEERIEFHQTRRGRELVWINKCYRPELDYILSSCEKEAWEHANDSLEKAVNEGLRLGRGSVKRLALESGESLIARRFLRGGLMARVSRDKYFHTPGRAVSSTRPIRELLTLSLLTAVGVRVPYPVCAVVSRGFGGICYRGLLVTKELTDTKNLLSLSRELAAGDEKFLRYSQAAGHQAGTALREGVFHRDLHLGNVLIGARGESYLIDFDKAQFVSNALKTENYASKLTRRFERSVHKHGLTSAITDAFVKGLEAGVNA